MKDQVDEPSALEQHLDRLQEIYRVAISNADTRSAFDAAREMFEIARRQES